MFANGARRWINGPVSTRFDLPAAAQSPRGGIGAAECGQRGRWLIFAARSTARLFLLRMDSLSLDTAADRRLGRLCFFPSLRRQRDSREHFAQLVEAIALVLPLISKSLAAQDQLSVARQPAGVSLDKSMTHPVGDACCIAHRPAQHRFGVDLVHILPARAGAAHERELKLVERDVQIGRNVKHVKWQRQSTMNRGQLVV